MTSKIKVLGINSSPRKYGNTFKLLRVALKAAEHAGADVSHIDLYDYELKPCQGCLSDDQEACRPPCLEVDDSWSVLKQIKDSDALIIATPIYWYGPSGQLKNLIEKLTVFENMIALEGRSWVEGKPAGFIAVGNDSGEIMTIAYLMVVFNSMGFLIPPWALAYYTGLGSSLERQDRVMDAANVGLAVVKAVKGLRVGEWYDAQLLDKLGGKGLIEGVEKEAMELKRKFLPSRSLLIRRMRSINPDRYR